MLGIRPRLAATALFAAAALGLLLARPIPGASAALQRGARQPARQVARVRNPSSSLLTPAQRLAAVRAQIAYAAMQSRYYIGGSSSLYRDVGRSVSDAWPYGQALAATISVAALPNMYGRYLPDLTARLRGLALYADTTDPQPAGYQSAPGPPYGRGGARFNDDNEWLGIELLRLFHISHQQSLLDAASGLLQMVTVQWSASSPDCAGGVPWSPTVNGDRNTVSNATGAELAAQLYLTTPNPVFLDWSKAMYEWTRACLLAPDGLYGDHIGADGTFDSTEWTYNQGTMIGTGAMLYQATRNPVYLDEALQTANIAIAKFTPEALAQQPISFDAIFIRNLLLLGTVSGDSRYGAYTTAFADDAWANVRDPQSNLFLADPLGGTQLIDQAAMVQVYALLAEPATAYF